MLTARTLPIVAAPIVTPSSRTRLTVDVAEPTSST